MRYIALLFPALLAAQSVVVPAGSFTMGRTKTTPDDATKMLKLLDMLEDLDDVQNVYSNADISDEVLAQAV